MNKISFYNTMTRQVEPFEPLKPGEVSLYCCGPTVYNFQHIGNLRTYVFEDTLVRTLKNSGFKVTHVMNITDVGHLAGDGDEGEDKMLLAAKKEKKKSQEIADYYTQIFFQDCAALNIRRPDIVCKATEHISEMIEMISTLEKKGYTYIANGNVYFDVSKFPAYGDLARLNLENQKAGLRVEVDSNKKNPVDFVLWFTKSKFENQELVWDSPWGKGYPGWHIECSAMARKYLGDEFDIHCGGVDHIPVHHTNEIAQSNCCTGNKSVRFWMHGEFLLINSEKMAKSRGNFFTLKDLRENGVDPLAYRFFLLSSHYRSQLNFTYESVKNAANAYQKVLNGVISLKEESRDKKGTVDGGYYSKALSSMQNDLGSALAITTLQECLGDKSISSEDKVATISKIDELLGLGLQEARREEVDIPEEVKELLNKRNSAKKEKNFSEADRLRNLILEKGFRIVDTKEGARVEKNL